METKEEQQRTVQQNRALHKLFSLYATALNDAGLDMRKVLKPEIDIPWTPATVKEFLWKGVQKAQLSKEHTADLTSKEVDIVFETVNRFLGEKFGIHEPFPSVEEIINKTRKE